MSNTLLLIYSIVIVVHGLRHKPRCSLKPVSAQRRLFWGEMTTMDRSPVTVEHYKAGMLLSGVGDAIGYKRGDWEFNSSGPNIHKELKKMGGIKKIKAKLPEWPLSDDTILHLATAEGLATGKEGEKLLHEIAALYIKGMTDMNGRAPGGSTVNGVSQLKPGQKDGYRVAYNPSSGGCGAAMRAMCIGLRYPNPEQLETLVAVAVETGRMTHTLPVGFLGAVAAALFTSYAVQRRSMTSWGKGLLDEACPIAKRFVEEQGYAVKETLRDWDYFSEKWQSYLDKRGLSNGEGPVIWPDAYGVAERDAAYKSFSFRGWGGSSGHDAPMIAYDALLGAGSDWEELMDRAAFHGGDSDSTAVIACCCWGVLYGTKGVPEGNYAKLEYRDRLEISAEQLYALSHSTPPGTSVSNQSPLHVSIIEPIESEEHSDSSEPEPCGLESCAIAVP